MGQSPSKRAESVLKNSTSFKQATADTYQDCTALTQHAFQGVRLYQLQDACAKIYALLSIDPDDPAAKFCQKWLPEPPTQLQIDETLRSKSLTTNSFLNQEEFEAFTLALFRDMAISKACRTIGWYIPVGFVAIFLSHVVVQRVPKIGPRYRTLDRPLSKIMTSYTAATAATVYYNLGA